MQNNYMYICANHVNSKGLLIPTSFIFIVNGDCDEN
jgi:hypothetical protein